VKLEWIGWVATALFASSYFFKQANALRKVQAGAALMWVVYGVIIHAFPVVVANVVVASVALYSTFLERRREPVTSGELEG
jgi:hypothetical protein